MKESELEVIRLAEEISDWIEAVDSGAARFGSGADLAERLHLAVKKLREDAVADGRSRGGCEFTSAVDPRHCWHWVSLRGSWRRDGFEGERQCCWCGRRGLGRKVANVPGHGPLYRLHGSEANDAEFVA